LKRHDEDFGQTLGKWGVPPGPYLMVPLLGPSNFRDAPAKLADEYSNGRHYIQDSNVKWGLWATEKLELRATLLDADARSSAPTTPTRSYAMRGCSAVNIW